MERQVQSNSHGHTQRAEGLVHDSFFWGARRPVVDVCDSGDRYVIEAEIPGFGVEELSVSVQKNILSIATGAGQTARDGRYILQERSRNGFSRSFTLPVDADVMNISIEGGNGVVFLQIPKK
jgi:HSP20 family protein